MTRPARQPDAPVLIVAGAGVRLSANAMRALEKATGHNLSELLTDDADPVARFQVIAFAELYRREAGRGHMPDAGTLWERAGDVDIDMRTEDPAADPTAGEFSTGSPPSADTGG